MTGNTWKLATGTYSKKGKSWLVDVLAKNRGLTNGKKLKEFLNPTLEQILSIRLVESNKAVDRLIKAIKNKEKIIVYSDYDADGICATAIVWETLYALGADILPHVPHRIKEGYGLFIPTIKELAAKGISLIITVDHGITAVAQIEEAKKLGVEIVVTDHHVKPKVLPKAYALVHSLDLSGAGVAWRFCWDLVKKYRSSYKGELLNKLELAAIATIADLVPLLGANRAIVKIGLEKIMKTKRLGIKSLIRASGISGSIRTYEIGHVLAPRINAMGRIEHGIEALRLICAMNKEQADSLAGLLSKTNTKRRDLTNSSISGALGMVDERQLIGVVSDPSWHEGIIGLVASRLVEVHHRPMIVISKGVEFSKGSARSIPGFNVIEAICASSELLIDAGGHPMAAGFSIRTEHIEAFSKSINVYGQKTLKEDMLTSVIKIECKLSTEDINRETLKLIEMFEPYGIGNPEPVFLTDNMLIEDVRGVGAGGKHLKLQLNGLSAIGFNLGEKRYGLRPGYLVDVVYTLDEDHFNGNDKIQLKIKDLRLSDS